MGIHSKESAAVVLFLAFACFVTTTDGQQTTSLVPAIITFGDSSVDVGNNNHKKTFFRANYPPYGRDFINHQPTGRFCNGKLVADFLAEAMGFTKYPPAYLSPEASGKNLLSGANFASAAAGYDDRTAFLNRAISLSQQYGFFQEYTSKLSRVAGRKNASYTLRNALYIVSIGTADFLQNYYVNPGLKKIYTPARYSSYLVSKFANFTKDLYGSGARRIGVTSLAPLGCLPATRNLFGANQNGCVSDINANAQDFNRKINSTVSQLPKDLPGLKIVVLDIFKSFYDIIKYPSKYGFTEAGKGCCETGTVKPTIYLCNPKSPRGTCRNATQYVFWDGVHPSQAANQLIADALILQGINLIS